MSKGTRNLPFNKKINTVIILIVLLIFVTIGIPSFCKLLMESDITSSLYWDGTTALSYNGGNGTYDNPYIISTPQELSLLATEVNNGNTYENMYFEITNDIYLNKGVIEYNNNEITYINESIKYYIKPYETDYYEEDDYQTKKGSIYTFPSLTTFKGTINGNNKYIYGLYMIEQDNKDLALFTNLEGTINNLSISNSLIYGTNSTGLINKSNNSTINNLFFNGTIKNNSQIKIINKELDDIKLTDTETTITIDNQDIPNHSKIENITLKGTYIGTGLTINNIPIEDEDFEITSTSVLTELVITRDELEAPIDPEEEIIIPSITNLTYEIEYYDDVTSLINIATNTNINNTAIKGNIIGTNITSGLVGVSNNKTIIKNTYNKSNITGTYISSGILGFSNNTDLTLTNIYNSGNITSDEYTGGLIGILDDTNISTITNSINTGNITGITKGSIVSHNNSSNITADNNYYTDLIGSSQGNIETEIATTITEDELLTMNFLETTLKYTTENWNLVEGELPSLNYLDEIKPDITLSYLDNNWTSINPNPKEVKIEETGTLTAQYEDHSDILKVEYYVSTTPSTTMLNPTEINYDLYKDKIKLDTSGYYTIYLKVTDVAGNIAYANTDILSLDGYNLIITDIYNNELKDYNNQITNTSNIKYKYQKELSLEEFKYNNNAKYYLVSDKILPNKTSINLIDNINSKIYNYIVEEKDIILDGDTYLYDLSLFKETGTADTIYFDNLTKNYYKHELLKEDFEFILDFKNTTITENINISLDLQTRYDNYIYSKTFDNLTKTFTIAVTDDNQESTNTTINLTSNFNSYINLSEENEINLSLENTILHKKLNNTNIYDSNLNQDKINLNIRLLDEEDNIVKGNTINGLSFKINDTTYYADNDGIVRIPLTEITNNLTISVDYLTNELINGIYYLNLNTCSHSNICSNNIVMPCNLENEITTTEHKFKVDIDTNDRLILRNKSETLNKDTTLNLNIKYQGDFKEPNVRVRLYQKLDFKATNQTYELIDLSGYILDNLKQVPNKDYEYYLVENITEDTNIDLSLNINNFGYGGYKLIFELYDKDTYITKDSKTILVK